jgi:predicted DNA-binding antitoxin AbrB/MazE fold protein
VAITVEAVYENGVLKLEQSLPLREHQKVRVTIQPEPSLAEQTNWVQETYGICGWKGTAEEADRFATDPELEYPPPPEES